MERTLSNRGAEGDIEIWLRESKVELAELMRGARRTEEAAFQEWLEHHPAFVPGARGPGGNSGHDPWPEALISQPRLPGINGKQPDFCWIASDSAEVAAMLVEIETPQKRWQRGSMAVQHADLTQAIEQLNSWRSWFERPQNRSLFLDEYLVPGHIASRHFTQEYILIHGSRAEFEGDRVRERQRASSIRGPDFQSMTFDRLLEIVDGWSARFGCVRREGSGYRAIAVPRVFSPVGLTDSALAVTCDYEEAVASSCMSAERKDKVLEEFAEHREQAVEQARFRPSPRIE